MQRYMAYLISHQLEAFFEFLQSIQHGGYDWLDLVFCDKSSRVFQVFVGAHRRTYVVLSDAPLPEGMHPYLLDADSS